MNWPRDMARCNGSLHVGPVQPAVHSHAVCCELHTPPFAHIRHEYSHLSPNCPCGHPAQRVEHSSVQFLRHFYNNWYNPITVNSFSTRLLSSCADECAHTYDIPLTKQWSCELGLGLGLGLGSPYVLPVYTRHSIITQHANAM